MKNVKIGLASLILVLGTVTSCIEHEVIPAPVDEVDLECFFEGYINGIPLKLTQNVDGIFGMANKAQNILPAPDFSSERYFFKIMTYQNSRAVQVGHGSVFWDGAVDISPSLTQFNNFNKNTLTPNFSDNALLGFEVRYTDANGIEWYTRETSTNFQDVEFSEVVQESDPTGDYSKFNCVFDCYVYHQDAVTLAWDSIRIQSTEMRGWFQR
jgi:hypothetical protein